jgi:SAM-dependent methyltransferase
VNVETGPSVLRFVCNITGDKVELNTSDIKYEREGILYEWYNSRTRAIVYMLSNKLFGKSIPLSKFPPMEHLTCIGMSDNILLGNRLSDIFNYTNTYYHMEPKLDIYDCENHYDKYDFMISSDVFEHINPYPGLDIAFKNLYRMLKDDGFIIFSVPFVYNETTIEHYPNLYNYKIVYEVDGNGKDGKGEYILYNRTLDGKYETFRNLIFHGGPGSTLELRLFCQKDLIDRFTNAGFRKITFLDPDDIDINEHGIYWENKCSLMMLIEK